ncbi:MAG: CBS domain-containing protein [Chloroflexi bacterium]|nr:MAG: CBS domain-containing protein [Chloroflexota bacterium]
MEKMVRDVMTKSPVTMAVDALVQDAARAMKDRNIGDVIVTQGDQVCGIVTDRDITVRAVAEGKDPRSTKLGDICSSDLITLQPDQSVDEAVKLMRAKAIRRLPVMEGSKPVGILALGDLATQQDEGSALADISSAPPNS